jgi:hypothetical protein
LFFSSRTILNAPANFCTPKCDFKECSFCRRCAFPRFLHSQDPKRHFGTANYRRPNTSIRTNAAPTQKALANQVPLGGPRRSLRFCDVIYLQLRVQKIHLTAAEEKNVMSSSR